MTEEQRRLLTIIINDKDPKEMMMIALQIMHDFLLQQQPQSCQES